VDNLEDRRKSLDKQINSLVYQEKHKVCCETILECCRLLRGKGMHEANDLLLRSTETIVDKVMDI